MKREFLKLLAELDETELREELKALYGRFPQLREYYKLELGGNTRSVVDKVKKDLHKAFFTGRRNMGRRARSNSNKILKDFKKISVHTKDEIELQFYRVAVMVEAIEYYQLDNEQFHDSLHKNFVQAAERAREEVMLDTFREAAETIIEHFESIDYSGRSRDLRHIFLKYWSN